MMCSSTFRVFESRPFDSVKTENCKFDYHRCKIEIYTSHLWDGRRSVSKVTAPRRQPDPFSLSCFSLRLKGSWMAMATSLLTRTLCASDASPRSLLVK